MKEFPKFIYGTAWKEEKTEELVLAALKAGFRAIDTANQRKHYFEEGVGQGIKRFLKLPDSPGREDLFLQTKFTFARGQDHRKPYDENDPFSKQVEDSFKSSLIHLGTDYLDSYILHGPYSGNGIGDEDLETWEAMEKLVETKSVKKLGLSNTTPKQLISLCERVKIAPNFVQNRCFARMGWDKEVRDICKSKGITYQGFSLLTANQYEISSAKVVTMAKKYHKTIPQIIFRFCHQIGMVCLTGTTNSNHMKEDLAIFDFELSPSEISQLEFIAF